MDSPETVFGPLAEKIVSIEGPLTSPQLDKALRLQTARDESWRTRSLIEAYQGQHNDERALRKRYANWILASLLAEAVVANAAFFLIGFQLMAVDKWVADAFFLGVFGQIAAGAIAIVKYLFPAGQRDPLRLIDDRRPPRAPSKLAARTGGTK